VIESGHKTVLLDEAVTALVTATEGIYFDATFGRGGHAAAILARLGQSGRLIAFESRPRGDRQWQWIGGGWPSCALPRQF
jgi:16S rRNA (cytosine1402-N4)-methyltransferase